jgi:hypothetical protein
MKAFFFLFLVVAIWIGLEVMNHGMGGAFGGLFVQAGIASESEGPEDTVVHRAGDAVGDAYRRSEERVSRQADEAHAY